MEPNLLADREALALSTARTLQANGYRAYLVGGCVRDRLLGVKPKDFDIGTDAKPQDVLRLFPNAQIVGAHFGVVVVRTSPGVQVEVATFRSEGPYTDGRHPDRVQFETDPKLDAQRRDFTINGLMQDPLTGQVFDFVGGRVDLAGKVIRAIGDPEARFKEDHLRMLRAVRFAARLEFKIEARTLAAIRREAVCVLKISAERIRDELVRILMEGHARQGFELLDHSKLLEIVLPEIKRFQGVLQPPEFHPEGDVWTHLLLMLQEMKNPSCTLAWGVLLHDVGKPATFRMADRIRFDGHAEIGAQMAENILCNLKFSNQEIQRVRDLVANHMRFKDVRHMRTSTLKRFLSLPHFDEHLELHRLDCLASNGYTDSYNFAKEKLAEFKREDLKPPRLITGRDLIAAGYKPGPDFSRALEAVETAQLEGEIHDKEGALVVARSILDPAA